MYVCRVLTLLERNTTQMRGFSIYFRFRVCKDIEPAFLEKWILTRQVPGRRNVRCACNKDSSDRGEKISRTSWDTSLSPCCSFSVRRPHRHLTFRPNTHNSDLTCEPPDVPRPRVNYAQNDRYNEGRRAVVLRGGKSVQDYPRVTSSPARLLQMIST